MNDMPMAGRGQVWDSDGRLTPTFSESQFRREDMLSVKCLVS